MQNQEIIKIIENLKGRKNYEQKKATKLGFPSLYAYFEDKILKKKQAVELKKNKIKIVIVIIGRKNLIPFLPKTIGIEVNKPSQAFLEKVKNAAKPVDIRKLKAKLFLNKLFPLSINNAMQNGQTKFNQDAA